MFVNLVCVVKKFLKPKIFSLFSFFIVSLCSFLSLAAPSPNIYISQIVDHPGLNLAYDGFTDALKSYGFIDQQNIKLHKFTAAGQINLAAQIAQKIMASNPDLVVAISTPSVQSLVSARKDENIPIIFTSVTDHKLAKLDQVENITGAIDYPSIDEVLSLVRKMMPKAAKIGLIYNAGEANSVSILGKLKDNKQQFEIVAKAINNTQQIAQAAESIGKEIDLMLVTTDNTVVAGINVLFKVISQHQLNVPVIVMDSSLAKFGAVASIGFSQYEVGYKAGEKAAKILQGEKASNLRVETPDKLEIIVNPIVAKKFGIIIPQSILTQVKIMGEK
ncbi:ABC transporter substrate-binding protein [Rickettsiales endosymbiont of Stachyamoeba lipophora]|uniref:ABC transporter substrate-binding protein n=1 Tax=Rickettsiales endosymbiont of Stachyamoeba lipophora TaxID=2486578 RepID=UPI000F65229C|nr:ABC transporter substrate-binding protein [Rickettsiales endosymbiont of Stachyamoeba lipophora]AZL16029.1 ABC transporter substrate-binding protein [Rickettsiales endosymbiont of Stachyamoeba lipophora]